MFSKLNSSARVKPVAVSPERPLPKTVPAETKVTPGHYLKAVRERLQIGMREVQDASMVIASEEGKVYGLDYSADSVAVAKKTNQAAIKAGLCQVSNNGYSGVHWDRCTAK